jgi:hypothetical protein
MRISESYDRFKAFKSLYVPLTARPCEICFYANDDVWGLAICYAFSYHIIIIEGKSINKLALPIYYFNINSWLLNSSQSFVTT